MNRARACQRMWLPVVLLVGMAVTPARAMLFLDNTSTAASYNAVAPTGDLAGSGWNLTGNLNSFIGVPIDGRYLVTAKHCGWNDATQYAISFASGANRGTFYLSKTEHWDDPNSDLRVWKLSASSASFVAWAPLYTDTDEVGKDLVMFGRGYTRGNDVTVGTELKGWQWSSSGAGTKRWGTNAVSGYADYKTVGDGCLLFADFDRAVGGTEAMLANLDSGAGLFIKDGAVWKLAGIGYSVYPATYALNSSHTGSFNAAAFDCGGLYYYDGQAWQYLPESPSDIPAASYASRISTGSDWIMGIIPEPGVFLLLLLGGGYWGSRRR